MAQEVEVSETGSFSEDNDERNLFWSNQIGSVLVIQFVVCDIIPLESEL